MEGSKVCLQPIMDSKAQAHSVTVRQKPVSARIYFRDPPEKNFSYCDPVGDAGLWGSHRELMGSFVSSSISEWTLALNNWENTEEVEETSPKYSVD